MTPPVVFTEHAIRRYCERYAPWLDPDDARAMLERAAESALPLRERTKYGDEQWAIADPVARLVVKREEGKVIVVTIFCEEWYRASPKPGRGMKSTHRRGSRAA